MAKFGLPSTRAGVYTSAIMRCLRSLLLAFLDSCFTWFIPAWRRQGNEAAAALSRYINHFRPEIPAERVEELTGLQEKLRAALLDWRKEEVQKLVELIATKGESLRGFKRNALAEIVESFFIIMVVFMGIRTYYAQPFRIPTGSMQPSLNGIIVHPIDELPSAPKRWWDAITLGSSYIDETAPQDMALTGIRDETYWLLFTRTRLTFRGLEDGSAIELTVPAASGTVLEYLKEHGKLNGYASSSGRRVSLGTFRRGESVMRGRADAGDMVIVNRAAYHFRQPRRGETFVFDTRGIRTKASGGLMMDDQSGGTHYIKRLCGVPGDRLEVKSPQLFVNGSPAQEETIARVAGGAAPFNAEGYQGLPAAALHLGQPAFLTEGTQRTLRDDPSAPNLREYVALGDNTTNSLDSRYWGPVRQFNIIGPAAFTLWPFSSHWGGIE